MVSLSSAEVVLDRMEVTCSSISVYREVGVANAMAVRYDILHSLNFTAFVTRNLFPGQTAMIPDVAVKLKITDEILVSISIVGLSYSIIFH